mmetsp:Transcript_41005/g.95023  ORF Transcript_41005/g.95023 Transcript_41005/m.95023 type:complete len:218 (-) Transcript_41005:1344-1997(-)
MQRIRSPRGVGALEKRLVLCYGVGWVGHLGKVSNVELRVAHRTLIATALQCLQERSSSRREIAVYAVGPILLQHAQAGHDAERRDVLAIRTIQLRFDDAETAVHARRRRLVCLLRVVGQRLPNNVFDLLLVLIGDLRTILRPHQHASKMIRVSRHFSALALDDNGRKDRDDVRRELLDVLGHSQEHQGSVQVVAVLHQGLNDDIGVQDHEPPPQVLW